MSVTLTPTGSATISTTEYSLPANANYSAGSPQTVDEYVEVEINLANLAAGDQYCIRIYDKINGSSQRVAWEATVTGVQPYPVLTPSLLLGEGWDVTILKLAGVDRAIGWGVRNSSQTGSFVLGSAATVSSTEFSLPANANYSAGSPQTADEYLEMWIDTTNVVAGDSFRYRLYEKINGTSVALDEQTPLPGMGPVIFKRRIVGEGWDVTATKIAGTDRAIGWSLRVDTVAGGGGGVTPPVASATFPASANYSTVANQAVSIPVADAASPIGLVAISVKFAGAVHAEMIYIGHGAPTGFAAGYGQFSSIAGDGSAGVGYTFSVRRDDAWPKGTPSVFTVRACDTFGNVLL